MDEIKGEDNQITYTENHTEDSLLEKYRLSSMAMKIMKAKMEQLPQHIQGSELQIQMMEKQLSLNQEKQDKIEIIFKEKGYNLTEKIREIRDKYTDEELIEHIDKIMKQTKTEIIKDGQNYIFKTKVTQSEDDLLLELMTLKDGRIDLAEQLINLNKSLETQIKRVDEFATEEKQIREKLQAIKLFFAKRHKNVDKELDKKANARKEKKTAESL